MNIDPEMVEEMSSKGTLMLEFAIFWGMYLGNAANDAELQIAEEMKQWETDELSDVFAGWADEYYGKEVSDDIGEFFIRKLLALIIGNAVAEAV